jgi:hypothetical protein
MSTNFSGNSATNVVVSVTATGFTSQSSASFSISGNNQTFTGISCSRRLTRPQLPQQTVATNDTRRSRSLTGTDAQQCELPSRRPGPTTAPLVRSPTTPVGLAKHR